MQAEPQAAARERGIVAANLTKEFPGGHRAVDGVSLTAAPGEVVGVVGPNGAGKSTTLRMLATLLKPTSGSATVCGHDLRERRAVRRQIGVALQDAGLDPLMTAREHFEVQSALYELPAPAAKVRSDELLERFGLSTFADTAVGTYSGGTARRLDLALSFLHEPPVVIFDEPTVGLDPRSRRDVWSLVREWAAAGRVVLFSTQYLEEADVLCDRVYVIDGGKVVVEGTPQALKTRLGGARIRLQVEAPVERAMEVLSGRLPGATLIISDDALVMTLGTDTDAVVAMSDTVSTIAQAHLGLRSIAMSTPTLEDVFLHFTGSVLQPEPLSGKGMDLTSHTNRGVGRRPRS